MPEIRPSFDVIYMEMAETMARRSRCSKGVGAVIVSTENRPAGVGYNGPPAGWPSHENSCKSFCPRATRKSGKERDYSDCPANHAEINALLYSDFSLRKGGTIYITTAPCLACAKAIANSGLARVVWNKTEVKEHRDPKMSIDFLRVCGLIVEEV